MMEPLQRIPRYQMLMNNMIKRMPENHPQVQRLQEACATAAFIASCHVSDTARRAAVMWSCGQHIENFPAELVSPTRELVACLDVEDATAVPSQPNMLTTLGNTLTRGRIKRVSSTLFSLMLFDDVVVVVQRAHGVSAHQVIGVRDANKLVDLMKKAPVHNSSKKELVYVGAIPLVDLNARASSDTVLELESLPLPDEPNEPGSLHTFRDASDLTSASMMVYPPRVIQFLECLLKTQAVSAAKDNALQVRTIIDPANEYRGECTMFWTVYSTSQYERTERKVNILVYIGDADDALQLQSTFQVPKAMSIDLHEDTPTCTLVISDSWASQVQNFDASISDIVGICADLGTGAFVPERFSQAIPPPEPAEASDDVEVPVRRRIVSYKSNRTTSTSSGTQRARSLMNARARSSIQSSLMAMQEQQEKGTKRPASPRDVGESDFKRRTMRQASLESQGTEGTTIQRDESIGSDLQGPQPVNRLQADTIPEIPEPANESQVSSVNPDETLDLPNPFAAPEEVPPVPEVPHVYKPDAQAEQVMETSEPPAVNQPLASEPPAQEPSAQEPQAEEPPAPAPAPKALAPEPDEKQLPSIPSAQDTAEHTQEDMDVSGVEQEGHPAAAAPAPEAPASATEEPKEREPQPATENEGSAMPAAFSMAGLVKKSMRKEKSVRFRDIGAIPAVPPVPPVPLMSESLRQIAPKPLTAEKDSAVEAPTRRRGKSMISEEQLERFRIPELTIVEQEPADEPGEESLHLPHTDDVGKAMRESIKNVNDQIARLRRYRPAVHNANWTDDWIQFKNAARTLNSRWTQMERAYENNQMQLASLQLSQGQLDERVHLSQEDYTHLQDEANMVLPLRIQIEHLLKRCESLEALEQDARLENAELYNVRRACADPRCSTRSLTSCIRRASGRRTRKPTSCAGNYSR